MSGIATVPVCRLVSHVTVSYPWYIFDADGTPSAKRRKRDVKKSHSLDARMPSVAEDVDNNGGCHGYRISFNAC